MRDRLTGKKLNFGFGTIEVLVSLMVIVTAVSAVILVVAGNQDIKLDDDISNSALYRANEILKKAAAKSAVDFNNVVSSKSSQGIFQEGLIISDVSPCRKDVVASISWTVRSNRNQNISLASSLVSEDEAQALGSDCELAPPPNEWDIVCPPQYGYDLNPAGLAASGLDLIRRGAEKYIILTSNKGSADKSDIWIIDVTDKTSISLVSSLNVGNNANDVDSFGNYAFIAGDTVDNQLVVVNIADLANPATSAYVTLSGVDPTGTAPQAKEIYYYNDRVYVATWRTAGPEFHIFDVTNPSSPLHLGSREINHSVRSIVVRDNYAYLATSSDADEVIVLDVSNPAAIYPSFPGVGVPEPFHFNAPGTNDGRSVYALGNKLYLGRDRGTGANHDFMILDVSNPASVTSLGGVLAGLNSNTAIVSIIISGDIAVTATSDQNQGFMIYNVAKPDSITRLDSCNYSEKAVDLDYDGQYNYVANESNDALRLINSAANP